MRASMTRALWLALALTVGGQASAAAPSGPALLKAALRADACAYSLFDGKPGQRIEYRCFEAEDLEGHWFVVLRRGPKRLLVELRLLAPDPAEVVEHRAWFLRNHQRRLLTEADGYGLCDTRMAVPLERLDAILDRAEGPGDWEQGIWPALPKRAFPKTVQKTKKRK